MSYLRAPLFPLSARTESEKDFSCLPPLSLFLAHTGSFWAPKNVQHAIFRSQLEPRRDVLKSLLIKNLERVN
jgi:hypothetical protein